MLEELLLILFCELLVISEEPSEFLEEVIGVNWQPITDIAIKIEKIKAKSFFMCLFLR